MSRDRAINAVLALFVFGMMLGTVLFILTRH